MARWPRNLDPGAPSGFGTQCFDGLERPHHHQQLSGRRPRPGPGHHADGRALRAHVRAGTELCVDRPGHQRWRRLVRARPASRPCRAAGGLARRGPPQLLPLQPAVHGDDPDRGRDSRLGIRVLAIQYDAHGRRQEIQVGPVKTRFTYDQTDRVVTTVAEDSRQGVTLTTNIQYDEFGREIHRKVGTGATLLFQTTQAYGATGLVAARERRDATGTLLRQETFEYDSLSRLVDYQCQGTQPPVDEHGRALRRQRFTLTDYNGIARIQTTFADGSANTQAYTYSAQDPTQLVSISNTHPDEAAARAVTLEYDENGCMTRDEHGRTLVYNASRFLTAVYDSQSQLLCEYGYDATDRLVRQSIPHEPDTEFSYRGGALVAVTKGDRWTSFLADGGVYWGEVQQQEEEGSETKSQLWACDAQHSVGTWLDTRDVQQVHEQAYTPYGFSASASSTPTTIGFNGQWRDPVTGWYHLGAGYRVYNPRLGVFLQPDGWSPFSSGEINPYAYCLGDPINRSDASGHFSWRSFFPIVVGVSVAIGLAVLTGGTGLVAGMAIGAAVNVGVGVAYDLATGTPPTLKSIAANAFYGAAGGVAAQALAWAPASVAGKIAQAVTHELATNLVTLPGTLFYQAHGRALVSAALGAGSTRDARTPQDAPATPATAGYLAEWPLEQLRRQQRGAPPSPPAVAQAAAGHEALSSDQTGSAAVRVSSRETVTAEDVRSASLVGPSAAGGAPFTLQLGAVHRVAFTIDAQAVHVPAWDVGGSALSAAAASSAYLGLLG
ncbi:hypothetical protein BO99DRAFT_476557 [Aspergillus violaceofuscus CBS 115571]|uniref:Teneurin-like YD-shell domain-containing protein n=1 Tax=Aspergillus violaceofuscus (strain CBS 115571) TaxID=1450538 RepID=A0A2V5H0P6_ASPV1|nr:hypothetical protein BO99DRAFT_476557 [Aspergillus violaceofuscus CBS 115571]